MSFRLYLFHFKVLVNFGSQLVFFFLFFFLSVKHSCNMSTLLCVGGLGEGLVGVVAGGVLSHHDRALGP